MIMRLLFSTMLLGFLLAGCAQKPTSTLACQFIRHPLAVADPGSSDNEELATALQASGQSMPPPAALSDAGQGEGATTLAQEIRATMDQEKIDRAPGTERYSLLFISGGSQHGAFGAGFLDAWRLDSHGQNLPEFRVVTGISTGAILGLFAFTGETEKAVSGYSIGHERELLTPYVRMRGGEPTDPSYLKIARRGSMADLKPLRQRIAERIDEGMLAKLKAGYDKGRRYFVGVVDVDSGDAMVLDMTEMAARYFRTEDPARKQGVRACLVEAIVASSSAPLAAPPSFIDNRMYVDGGARFGIFSIEINKVLRQAMLEEAHSPLPPRYYLIVNGNQQVSQICGKKDKTFCTSVYPTGRDDGEHRKWNVLDLALRSEKILANQVYRFSVERISSAANGQGSPFRIVKIDGDADAHLFEEDGAIRSCTAWRDYDERELNPIQFYPHYMRCLMNYGRVRAKLEGWAVETNGS